MGGGVSLCEAACHQLLALKFTSKQYGEKTRDTVIYKVKYKRPTTDVAGYTNSWTYWLVFAA